MKHYLPIIVATIVVIGGFGTLFALAPQAQEPEQRAAIPPDQIEDGTDPTNIPENVIARNTCVEHGSTISMHIHPQLSIVVDGENVEIPANIGIAEDCMRAIHTHDATGTIHLEFPTQFDFTLADFFANWGETFNEGQILDHTSDEWHDVVMTVDGVVSTDYENLILKDDQKIVIEYLETSSK